MEHLREMGMRLIAELDDARLYQAAAYVSMAVDAMDPGRCAAADDDGGGGNLEFYFDLDEHGRVWM
jgi:hypothetical protein